MIWPNIGLSWKNKYEPPPFWFHIQNRYSIPQNRDFVFTVLFRDGSTENSQNFYPVRVLFGISEAFVEVTSVVEMILTQPFYLI